MTRFYYNTELKTGMTADLPDGIARHIKVLRLQSGDKVRLFNGKGGEYEARLIRDGGSRWMAALETYIDADAELPYGLTLAQALPEAGKMDWIAEKAAELGVKTIVPLSAARSVTKLSGDRAEKRIERWKSILISACEQCGRNTVPEITLPEDALSYIQGIGEQNTAILFTPRARVSLAAWAKKTPPRDVILLIGPEGGFSEEEEKAAEDAGAVLLSMGSRILRTETAGLAAAAALNAVWEDGA